MSDDEQVRAKVALLTRVFVAKLPVRLASMDACLALCHADTGNGAHWQELRRLLHSLAGAAGTFGLPELGQAARDVEMQLDLRLDGNNWTLADVAAYSGHVNQLRALCHSLG